MARICIAGGGIGGLSLGVALHRLGADVLLLERQTEVRDTGAGISLWPNALAALDSIELGSLVRDLGAELASGGQRKLDGRPGVTFGARRFRSALGEGLVCVDRGLLVRTLVEQLPSGSVRTGCTVTGYRMTPGGVQVEVEGGEPIEASALVGADGVNSAVANQLGGPFTFRYSGYVAWRAIAEMGWLPDRESIWACLARGHEFGWLPVGGGRTYWFATACRQQGEDFPGGDLAYLSHVFGDWPDPVSRLIAATQTDRLVRNDIVDRSFLSRWSDGPVTVLGDAAHPMRPHLGQGGCQALEDAAALAACLTVSSDPAAAFREYERRRRRRARLIVRLSRRSGFTYPQGPAIRAFDFVGERIPQVGVGFGLRAIAPIAGYKAGATSPASG